MVVIHADDRDLYDAAVAPLGADLREKLLAPVVGGATRQESVRNGLDALSRFCGAEDLVLIHDAARPFVSPAAGRAREKAAREKGAAIPGVAVVDTIKQIAGDARIVATPARAALRAVQTPQALPLRPDPRGAPGSPRANRQRIDRRRRRRGMGRPIAFLSSRAKKKTANSRRWRIFCARS